MRNCELAAIAVKTYLAFTEAVHRPLQGDGGEVMRIKAGGYLAGCSESRVFSLLSDPASVNYNLKKKKNLSLIFLF
jgi:hypothetical protein